MSYRPTIVINFDDLIKHQEAIELGASIESDEDTQLAYAILEKELIVAPVVFPEKPGKRPALRLTIIEPELSSQNRNVRDLLDELEIEYQLQN